MSIEETQHRRIERRHVRRSAARLVAVTAFVLGAVAALLVLAGVQALGGARARGATTATATATATSAPAAAVHSATPSQVAVPAVRPSAWKPSSSAEVPPGAPVPVSGAGSWRVVPGGSAIAGTGALRTYTVEIEDGVHVPEGDAAFAGAVDATLADPRSWIAQGKVAWKRVSSGEPRLRIRLASRDTARAVCGYEIPVDVSCHDGGVVVLSAVRWIRGAVAYDGDLAAYRHYMVNHEVGHSLGKSHRPCTSDGGPAPVMMQQTFSTSNDEIRRIIVGHPQGVVIPRDGKVCTPNPWPVP